MLHPPSPLFDRLLEQINALPVIDTHEHLQGPEARPAYKEPIAALIQGYVFSDLQSAGFGIRERDLTWISTLPRWTNFWKPCSRFSSAA